MGQRGSQPHRETLEWVKYDPFTYISHDEMNPVFFLCRFLKGVKLTNLPVVPEKRSLF